MFIAVETKIGKNGQSVGQKEYQLEVEGAGGSYWLIYDFDDFKRRIDNFKRG